MKIFFEYLQIKGKAKFWIKVKIMMQVNMKVKVKIKFNVKVKSILRSAFGSVEKKAIIIFWPGQG